MKEIRLTNKVKKTFQGNSKGVSLIEALVALGLLGIIAVAFLVGMATASKAMIIADERATAESLARSQMEYVKNLDYDYNDLQSYEQVDEPSPTHPGYFISVVADSLHDTDKGIQMIKVTVSHGGEGVITLEDYKVDR